MPNMEDIRRIANQNYRSAVTQAVLTNPMCILLLGAEATKRADELRARLNCRWSNANSHLTVATVRFEEGVTRFGAQDDYVINPYTGNSDSRKYIKLQLTKVAQIIESDQRKRAPALANVKVCVVTSSGDAEACWAGPLMMLLNAQYAIGGSNVGNTQLFCLLAPSTWMLHGGNQSTFGGLLSDSWLDASKIDEALYYAYDDNEKLVEQPVNNFYVSGTPIFRQTFFVGVTNSRGMAISEDDRLNMLVTFMDPSSGIDWRPQDNKRFYSGYLYPNQMEPGADLAIVWHICQNRFSAEHGANAPETDLKKFNAAHRPIMQQAYETAQQNVSKALPNIYVRLEGETAKKSKYDFLWLCQYQNMQEKVLEWQEKYEEALCDIWSLDWLRQNADKMLMEYDTQNRNNVTTNNGDGGADMAHFNGPNNEKKIKAHMKGLNAWAQDKINQRKAFLQEMQRQIMAALNADSDNVYEEIRISLGNIGWDGITIGEVLEKRDQYLQALPQIDKEIYPKYVHHMSHIDGRQRLENFLSETAKIIFSPKLALEPQPMPAPTAPCYAFQPVPGMFTVDGWLETVPAGMSRGKYYYNCAVDVQSVPGLMK